MQLFHTRNIELFLVLFNVWLTVYFWVVPCLTLGNSSQRSSFPGVILVTHPFIQQAFSEDWWYSPAFDLTRNARKVEVSEICLRWVCNTVRKYNWRVTCVHMHISRKQNGTACKNTPRRPTTIETEPLQHLSSRTSLFDAVCWRMESAGVMIQGWAKDLSCHENAAEFSAHENWGVLQRRTDSGGGSWRTV